MSIPAAPDRVPAPRGAAARAASGAAVAPSVRAGAPRATRRPGARTLARAATALGLTLGSGMLGACASMGAMGRAAMRPYALAPNGLELPEQALRDALVDARWDAARRQIGSPKAGGPGDALLRTLYEGTAAYYAGDWRASAGAFDRAAALADDRVTKRMSRGALALATNDRALPYLPGANERLLVHYYAMLAWLRRGDVEGAAVEARRLAFRLERDGVDGAQADDRTLRATMRYLTGAVFEAAGDFEDAGVAYRNAERLARGLAIVPDTAARAAYAPALATGMPSAGRGLAREGTSGEVVVVLERGFVAHRVNDRLSLAVGPASDRWLARLDARDRALAADDYAALTERLSRQLADDDGVWADSTASRHRIGLADRADSLAAREAADEAARARREAAEREAAERAAGRAPDATAAADDARPAGGPRPAIPRVLGAPAVPRPAGGAPAPWRGERTRAAADTLPVGAPTTPRAPDPRTPTTDPTARTGDRGAATRRPRRTPPAPVDAVRQRPPAHVSRWPVMDSTPTIASELDAMRWGGRTVTIAWAALAAPRAMPRPTGLFAATAPQVLARLAPGAPTAAGVALPLAGSGAAVDGGRAGAAAALSVGSALGDGVLVAAGDVSRAMAGDFRRDRPARLARLLARAALKQTLVEQAERKDRALGALVGMLSSVSEQADTRSWHLLPGAIEIVRLRLPAGTQPLTATVGGRVVPLGDVTVRPGRVSVVSARLWGDDGRATVAGARSGAAGI